MKGINRDRSDRLAREDIAGSPFTSPRKIVCAGCALTRFSCTLR